MELKKRIIAETIVIDLFGPFSNAEAKLARDAEALKEAAEGGGPLVISLHDVEDFTPVALLLAHACQVALDRGRPIPLVTDNKELRRVFRFGHDLFIAYGAEARAIESANSERPEDWA